MGKAVTYLTNTLIRLGADKKLDPEKDFGVKGFYVEGKLVKSRNNAAGIQFKMVYDQEQGFDNDLTNFVNLKDMGMYH